MIVPRLLTRSVRAALADTPVVLIAGARQVGKTTLVRQVVSGGRYLTLDDPALRDAARSDALGFLDREIGGTLVIDELQRAPELFQAIKLAVDRGRQTSLRSRESRSRSPGVWKHWFCDLSRNSKWPVAISTRKPS